MLIVEGQHGSLAFCDNGHCSIRVAAIAEFTPDLSYPGPAGMEFAGAVRCACGTARAVAGPAGNWSLGYCACGRGVLGRPRPEALAPAAVAS